MTITRAVAAAIRRHRARVNAHRHPDAVIAGLARTAAPILGTRPPSARKARR